MNNTTEYLPSVEYSSAVAVLERARISGRPEYILDNLREAVAFWESRKAKTDDLDNRIEEVMLKYQEAKNIGRV